MGEKYDHALNRVEGRDHPVGPIAHRGKVFTAFDRCGPYRPGRIGHPKIGRAGALELAVVPLHQVVDDCGSGAQSGQLTGATRSLQWAGQHGRRLDARSGAQDRLQEAGPLLAMGVERDVSVARMEVIYRPRGFPVSDHHHALGHGRAQ